jgi:hypothetical protein
VIRNAALSSAWRGGQCVNYRINVTTRPRLPYGRRSKASGRGGAWSSNELFSSAGLRFRQWSAQARASIQRAVTATNSHLRFSKTYSSNDAVISQSIWVHVGLGEHDDRGCSDSTDGAISARGSASRLGFGRCAGRATAERASGCSAAVRRRSSASASAGASSPSTACHRAAARRSRAERRASRRGPHADAAACSRSAACCRTRPRCARGRSAA